jgi:hypothetical protein
MVQKAAAAGAALLKGITAHMSAGMPFSNAATVCSCCLHPCLRPYCSSAMHPVSDILLPSASQRDVVFIKMGTLYITVVLISLMSRVDNVFIWGG